MSLKPSKIWCMSGLSYDPGHQNDDLDRLYMKRCIELAKRGGKHVRPNPMVGSVLVHQNKIIGEGYHEQFGKAHAEVNCLRSVELQHRKLIPTSTLYVSLEPCNIVGKTPACSDLILSEHLQRLVVGALDPNPLVNGSSLDHLRTKGVVVKHGVCKNDAEQLIRPFSVNMNSKRPYVILKTVKSSDHFIGRQGEKIWLSNEFSSTLSHKWRTEVDGILVGTTTALMDNPSLTARLYPGENPIRIVLDRSGKIPIEHAVFSNEADTIVFTELNRLNHNNISYIKIDFQQKDFIDRLLQELFSIGVYVLMIEGGAQMIRSFLDSGKWDEARVITTSNRLFNGVAAPNMTGKLILRQMLDNDELQIIYNEIGRAH
ncbi:MAG TPA: bifunctional diaminohydroxyphosphoribosylaminopyrimidine deaminase/5-amino-6-(5-phosphoribosylamino)uracil reductase RibD, partial [Saprospirales bacterium]|nr:bifunctional diaminohydroxyphosphoribosylaminopyrimidine deaminase/5-amino-6-(5-phosphoribosylamino)uracil reductase RibD [Saprospirales bacterium]